MNKNELIEKLGELGFPLFQTEERVDANQVLVEMIKSNDTRLLEGFPLVFANCNEKGLCNFNKLNNQIINNNEKEKLFKMVILSVALYKYYDLKFSWTYSYQNHLKIEFKDQENLFIQNLKTNNNIIIDNYTISPERLKKTFQNYFTAAQTNIKELLSYKDEFDLEFALSQVFSPKQKELFMKRINGKKLTKTEQEYYSRTVKKKIIALANDTLHRLSQKLLE